MIMNQNNEAERAFAETDKKIDIYSYSIVLWEVLTQSDPFPEMKYDDIIKTVIRGERPSLNEDVFPIFLKDSMMKDEAYLDIIRACWSHHPEFRPPAKDILNMLETGINAQ